MIKKKNQKTWQWQVSGLHLGRILVDSLVRGMGCGKGGSPVSRACALITTANI